MGQDGERDWLIAEPVPPSLYDTVAADPRVDAAIRGLAAGMLAVSAADPAIEGIFKDGGRYVAAMCVAALQTDGVTLPALKALCAGFAMLSAGRARALLIYMRYLGYVSLWRVRGGGPARYAIAPAFLDAWTRHLVVALEAAAILDPLLRPKIARLAQAEFLAAFCLVQMRGLMASAQAEPATHDRLFAALINHHGGTQLLWSLLAHGEAACPPDEPVRIVVAEIARRARISAVQVRRLLHDAEAAGIIERLADGRHRIPEPSRAELRLFYVKQIVRLHIAFAHAEAMVPA